jgi:glutathione S-transferase
MANVIVHHLEYSRATRVLWLLEELGVEYDIVRYERDPKTWRAQDDLRAVHPLGRAPVVEVDGTKLVESGAILEELLDRFGEGRLRPQPLTDEMRRYRLFLHFAESSMMTPLFISLLTARVRKAKLPFFVKPIARRIADQIDGTYTNREMATHLDFLERELEGREYFAADELTAADIQMSYALEAATQRAGLDGRHPNLVAHMERTKARAAYQRAVERAGPVMPERG